MFETLPLAGILVISSVLYTILIETIHFIYTTMKSNVMLADCCSLDCFPQEIYECMGGSCEFQQTSICLNIPSQRACLDLICPTKKAYSMADVLIGCCRGLCCCYNDQQQQQQQQLLNLANEEHANFGPVSTARSGMLPISQTIIDSYLAGGQGMRGSSQTAQSRQL